MNYPARTNLPQQGAVSSWVITSRLQARYQKKEEN